MNFINSRRGFSLAEMMISMAIIAILFISLSSFITRFLQSRINAAEFVDVQDESYIHVQMLEALVKSAKNVLTFRDNSSGGSYLYDNLLIQNDKYSSAPFTIVKALKKTTDAPKDSYQHLDEVTAANHGVTEERFMAISSLYIWSDVTDFRDNGRLLIYPDPSTGKIKIFDTSTQKTDTMAFAQNVDFGSAGDFLMPTGIERKGSNEYFVSDRSDHTVWKITLAGQCTGETSRICSGTREKILGQSGVSGALECNQIDCSEILLNQPNGLLYHNRVLYVADSGNNRILKWDGSSVTELIKTDSYESGKSSDGEGALPDPDDATKKGFFMNTPIDLALDANNTLYVSDSFNHRIISLSLASGSDNKVHVFAGTGEKGFSGDFGEAQLARMNFPTGLSFHTETSVISGVVTIQSFLYLADSGNNLIRRVSFVSYTDKNSQLQVAHVIAPYIGDSDATVIPEDFVSTVLTRNATTFSPQLGQRAVSQKKPVASAREIDDVLQQDEATNQVVQRKRLPSLDQGSFNFPTGLFVNPTGDTFIIDGLNNQIKLAVSENTGFTNATMPQPNLLVNLGSLDKTQLIGKVFPIIRSDDYGNYRFTAHVFSGEHDYISPYPLQHMFFAVSGSSDKIVMCNLAITGLKSEELSSNNFQFSLSLRNPVDEEM